MTDELQAQIDHLEHELSAMWDELQREQAERIYWQARALGASHRVAGSQPHATQYVRRAEQAARTRDAEVLADRKQRAIDLLDALGVE